METKGLFIRIPECELKEAKIMAVKKGMTLSRYVRTALKLLTAKEKKMEN